MTDPLDEFLKQKSESGHLEGETAEFTLNQEAAWRKLGAYQLSAPETWVLKLVQAAVVDRALEIEVRQDRSSTKIWVHGVPSWSPESLLKAIYQPLAAEESGIGHLSSGIRSIMLQGDRRMNLMFPTGKAFFWNGSAMEEQEEVVVSETFRVFVGHETIGTKKSWLGIGGNADCARYSAALLKQFEDNCSYSPVPIKIDSRRLGNFFEDHQVYLPVKADTEALPQIKLDTNPYFEPLKASFWRKKDKGWGIPESFFDVNFSGYQHRGELPGAGVFLRSRVEPGRLLGGLKVDRLEKCSSSFEWVKDGVVIERLRWTDLDSLFGVKVVADAGSLKTDLSGLALIDNQEKRVAFKKTVAKVLTVLDEVKVSFHRRFKARAEGLLPSEYSSIFAEIVIKLLALIVSIVGFPIVILLIVTNYFSNLGEKRIEKALDEQELIFRKESLAPVLRFLNLQISDPE